MKRLIMTGTLASPRVNEDGLLFNITAEDIDTFRVLIVSTSGNRVDETTVTGEEVPSILGWLMNRMDY